MEVAMRIAVLAAAKSIHTQKWVKALKDVGHEVKLYSLPEHRAKDGIFSKDEVTYLKLSGTKGYFFGATELRKLLLQFKPDVVNAHYATGYGTLARRSRIKPVLLSVWGSDVYEFPYKSFINKMIISKNLDKATLVASTSNAMALQVNRVHFVSNNILITPFGVDSEVFKKCGEPETDKITIGIVKALEEKYGVEYLLKAFSMLKKRMMKECIMPEKGLYLEIYGGGVLENHLKALAKKLEIDGDTTFHGPCAHSKVPEIISSFDIFCAPSINDSESFGVAAVEAMACEVPVVVGDVDGFKEVVVDGKTGFIVTRKDPVILSNKLYILACDKKLRISMGKAGREHVKENYEWRDCVVKMSDALRETVLTYRNMGKYL